jgi:hypothetical protein
MTQARGRSRGQPEKRKTHRCRTARAAHGAAIRAAISVLDDNLIVERLRGDIGDAAVGSAAQITYYKVKIGRVSHGRKHT